MIIQSSKPRKKRHGSNKWGSILISHASSFSVFITGHFINYVYILAVWLFLDIATSHVLVSMSPYQCSIAKPLRFRLFWAARRHINGTW